MTLFGIDVSDFQGDVDAARMRSDGVEFVIIKATEGSSWKGQHFAGNLQRARDAGQLVAAYHYVRGDVSASAQVANVISVVPLDVPVILDVEANSGDISMARAILTALNTHGYRTPLMYLPRWYWQQIGSPDLSGLPPLWSSHYPDNVVGSLAGKWAQIPDSYWAGYGGLNVAVLQFTSSASVGGRQPLDANAFRGTRDELAALLHQGDDLSAQDTAMITQILDQVMGPWPSYVNPNVKLTLVDYARAVDERTVQQSTQIGSLIALLGKQSGVTADQIAAALQPGLVTAVLPAIEAALTKALGADNAAQATAVAHAVVAELAANLATPAAPAA